MTINMKLSDTEIDDEVSIDALRNRDEKAYEVLVTLYQKPLISVVMRVVYNYDEALEVVQDVFLSLYKNIDKFESRSKIYTWLYRVAVNRSIDLIRKREREKKTFSKVYTKDYHEDEDTTDKDDYNFLLSKALDKLDDNFKLPLLFAEYENYSYEEISAKLGIPINTVRTRIFRGRKKLLSILQKMGVSL